MGQRGPDDLPHALALTQGHHLGFDHPPQHGVLRLVGDDPVESHFVGQRQGVGDLPGRPFGDAHVVHLALAHQVVKSAERLFERGFVVETVRLEQVHVVGPEALEGSVE